MPEGNPGESETPNLKAAISGLVSNKPLRLFLVIIGASWLASGMVAGLFETFPLPLLFGAVFGTTLLATIVMLLLVKPVRALMKGVH